MPQLYIQKSAQPDTWVMSGAPTATTVFLSLDAAINYSDGTSDTLPANTLAVLPDTTTVFDRTHDVYVCYTVQTSRVLSVIKESLLPTLTSAYAPLCRIELHGIKPYQPEPYLAAGGLGSAATTSASVPSTAGTERVFVLGTEPASWQATGFDDSAWALSVPETLSVFGGPIAGTQWIAYSDTSRPGSEEWLVRRTATLPAGLPTAASLEVCADDILVGAWVNGTAVATGVPLTFTSFAPQTLGVPPALLLPGAANVVALHLKNAGGGAGLNPSSVDYLLSVTYGGAGTLVSSASPVEGDLLYYHGGTWTDLPIGPTGDVLSSNGTDPAWAAPATSGTVTSVAVAAPAPLAASGGPITASGTITLSWASGQTANRVLASPDGTTGAVSLRALAPSDVPSLPASQIGSGQLAAARGGTGVDGSAAANGALLIGTGSGYSLTTLTAGSGVTITNGSGTVTIASTGGGSGTVTSVALTVPGFLSVSGSPITASGTLAVTLANENAATVFAGPASGSAAAPTFRALAASDLPPAAAAGGHVHAHGHFL